jgi:hypothetical protein
VNTGLFLNESAPNLHVGLVVFIVIGAPTFGYFFNRLMDRLNPKYEHTSLYVVIGVFVTLVFISLLSWKSAVFNLVVFGLTGLPMIVGEFLRTERKRKTARVKRLPYKANGLIDDAKMASTQAHQHIARALNTNDPETQYKHLAAAGLELTTVFNRLNEVKQIQLEK